MKWLPQFSLLLAMIAMVGCYRPVVRNTLLMKDNPMLHVGVDNPYYGPTEPVVQLIEAFRITDLNDRVLWEHWLEEPIELRVWESRKVPLSDALCPPEYHEALRGGKVMFFALYIYPRAGDKMEWKKMYIPIN